MFGYHVPAPDQAMLVSGGKTDGAPFRVVTGHGAFVLPFVRKVEFITLSMFESEVSEPCVTRQGIALNVTAVIAAKVGNDSESIVNAGQRFLSDQNQMSVLTGRIFAGHLRSIIGSMTVEEIITERQKLATEVLEGSKGEMAKMGLIVDALQIQSIDDMKLGYIAAMAAPHNAKIQQAAQIAQAAADQASAEAQQQSLRMQAQYERETAVTRAGYAAETQVFPGRFGLDERVLWSGGVGGIGDLLAIVGILPHLQREIALGDCEHPLILSVERFWARAFRFLPFPEHIIWRARLHRRGW